MNKQKAFTDQDVAVLFFLGCMLGALTIAIVAIITEPANPLEYGRTCDAATEVVVLLADAEGRGNEKPHACLPSDRVIVP